MYDTIIDFSNKADTNPATFLVLASGNIHIENLHFKSTKEIAATNAINANSDVDGTLIKNITFDDTLTYGAFSYSLTTKKNFILKNDVPTLKSQIDSVAADMRFIGVSTFDTTLGKPVWWNGRDWSDANGEEPEIRQKAGTWSKRPNADGSYLENGYMYFLLETEPDEDPDGNPIESLTGNGKAIWWIQDGRKWVDATGATVTG